MNSAAPFRALLALSVVSSVASAQSALPTNFSVERLQISPSRSGVLDAEWGGIPRGWSWDVGVYYDESRNPLVLYRESDFKRVGVLLRTRTEVGVLASLAYGQRISLGVDLPFTVVNAGPQTIPGVTEGVLHSIRGTALGNLRLVPKIGILLYEQQGIDLALLPTIFVPTGPDARYVGDPTVVFAPEIALSRPIGNFRPVLNLTATVRPHTVSFVNEQIGNELSARLGLAYRFNQINPSALPLEIGATLTGSVPMRRPFEQFNEDSLEVKAYAGYTLFHFLNVFAGGGAGLAKGWGTPDWRVFAGLRLGQWDERPVSAPKQAVALVTPAEPDTDGDGLRDSVDACPRVPGPLANQGCPDADRDRDGIPDRLDLCPTEPEDKDRWQDDDGCPDPDNDGDGVLDKADPCPNMPGPVENHGCPDTDRDHDGVVDRLDACPDERGTAEFNGCKKKQLAVLQKDRILILDAVYFDTARTRIQKRSFPLLDNVARILEAHPELSIVRIEGHTDSRGADAANLRLSQGRSDAVRDYLIRHGILAIRLQAVGFGESHPIADNATSDGRAKNRRVEFKLKTDDAAGASTGKGQ